MIAEQLTITLTTASPQGGSTAGPYHRQIYEQVRAAILAGRLRPSERLPSTRDLANRLELARNTVARAYADLLAEGYLVGQTGSGTYVAPQLPGELLPSGRRGIAPTEAPAAARDLAAWGVRALREVPDRRLPTTTLTFDFRPGIPDWKTFPRQTWLRLLGRALQRDADLHRYGEPAGYLPLRRAIARHLATSRGVVADAEQVVIVSGSQQALDLLARLWIEPGATAAVEDPGYPEARRVLAAAGADLLSVPVDGDGLRVDELASQASGISPRLVYVTPSHQFPTGVTLTLSRRLALLDWAARRDVLVVEDDYDSEFRYSGRPVESLQGLDRSGRVVYLGTFSTVLFPPLRVGYVVLPPGLVEPFVKAKWLVDRQTATLEQIALADLLEEGHFDRHLRRMRRLAAERRAALLQSLETHLAGRIEQPSDEAGMHLTLPLVGGRLTGRQTSGEVERRLAERAAAAGVGVYPVASCCARPWRAPAILLGYAALPVERIREGVRRLGVAAAEVLGS